jgi:hypothetical protein
MQEPVVERHPPDVVVRMLNPVLRTILRSPLGRAIGSLAVLQFQGRRTDRTYHVVTGWYQVDGQEFAVTPSVWRINLKGGAPLSVTARGRTRSGRGELVTDPATVSETVRRLLDSGTSATALGIRVAQGHRFDDADVAATRKALIRFTPESS